MTYERKASITVGILYILGTVFGILSVVMTNGIVSGPSYLQAVHENQNPVRLGMIFIFLMGISLSFIPIILFPILRKFNTPLAVAYVVFRSGLETMMFLVSILSFSALLLVSAEYHATGFSDQTLWSLGNVCKALTNQPVTTFVFCIDAFILYLVLYFSRLVPRWISVFGFAAIALHSVYGALVLFNLQYEFSLVSNLINVPILIQEMVMAVWFIVKGFDKAALDGKSFDTAGR